MENQQGTQPPLFRSPAQARLLARLFLRPVDGISLSQLAMNTGLPLTTVHREVSRLERAGILRSERVGGARLVRPDEDSPLHEDLRSLLVKAFGPAEVVGAALSDIPGISAAFIFGSWARQQRDGGMPPRDVDVVVIGTPDLDRVYRACRVAEGELGLEVHPTVLSDEEWDSASTGFLRTVRAGPLVEVVAGAME